MPNKKNDKEVIQFELLCLPLECFRRSKTFLSKMSEWVREVTSSKGAQ